MLGWIVPAPFAGIQSRWKGLEDTPYICQGLTYPRDLNFCLKKKKYTGRESLPQRQLGTPELGCHGPTPEAAPTHSPVLLGHILVVDVPADVAVWGADALAANVLGALQGTGAM